MPLIQDFFHTVHIISLSIIIIIIIIIIININIFWY